MKPELPPGLDGARRVLRLACRVRIEAQGAGVSRSELLTLLEAALYSADAPDLRTGAALRGDADQGFFVKTARVTKLHGAADPLNGADGSLFFEMSVDGWFWPVGTPGTTGEPIAEIRFRGSILPLELEPAAPVFLAGSPPQPLSLGFRISASSSLRASGHEPLPMERMALSLVRFGGGVAAGQLAGALPGAEGVSLAERNANGRFEFTYTPPAQPAREELIAAFEDGRGGLGVQLGRFPLIVRSGP